MPSVRLAFRTLAKAPFVTAVAVGSLALGIGANTAIFSMFQRILLRPLPVADAGALVNLESPGPRQGSTSCNNAGDCDAVFSYPMFRDLERTHDGLVGVAGHRLFGVNLAFRGQSLDADGMLVSGSYFSLLGLSPSLGRLLGPEDDRTIGGHFVAVLSHDYWVNRLGRDPSVLDQAITINGKTLTIVGVAPAGFEGTTLGARPFVFVPLAMRGEMRPGFDGFENRRNYWVYAFGRLEPGVARAAAAERLNRTYRAIINDVEAPLQTGMSEATLAQFRARILELSSGARGQSTIRGEAATPLAMLISVTGIVLLIAAINVANLLLARAAARAKEMAVRLSLGASRRQLLGQLLTESLLLAGMAALVSLLVARGTLALLTGVIPAEVTAGFGFSLDGTSLLFAAALALGTGLLFGLVPALQSTRPELVSVIKAESGKTAGTRAHTRFRTGMVTAQFALSMALLATAALFIRSLVNVSRVELGLDTENVVTFDVQPALNGYSAQRTRDFFRRLEEELRGQPGVIAATEALVPILAGDNWNNDVSVEGFKAGPDADVNASLNYVGPGYFATLGVPLLAGREFTTADDVGTPEVVIVNEAFTRKFGLGRDAIGKRMAMGRGDVELDIEIVGLVRDAKYSDVKREIPPQFFLPHRQDTTLGAMSFYVRTAGPSAPILREIPRLVARLDPTLPVAGLKTLPEQVKETLVFDRMIGLFSTAFAALATLLAAIGLYGVLAYLVAQRTREIGVRMALGADSGSVRGMVLRQVGGMAAAGGAIGIAGAVAVGQAARSILFEVKGVDPLAIAAAALVLGTVALGAGYLPARRASLVDPIQALRDE